MAVRKPPYTSAFAERIVAYIDFKASMGLEGLTRNYVLYDFDKWCVANGAREFDAATVEAWVDDKKGRMSPDYGAWMSIIRDFGRYLRASGSPDAYVLSGGYSTKSARPIPYLLSRDEAEAFFEASTRLKWSGPMKWQATCLFGLMYSCGLRPGEARRLRMCDIRADELEIDIVKSKCNRSRRLAVSGEVMEMISRSDAMTTVAMGADRPFLFMSAVRGQVSASSTSEAFRRIWRAAGLPSDQHGRKPTCYLLRHHFAYANVERWAAEGLDPNAMLPYLQRYMGHASADRTLYYVHTSPDFMAGYADAVAGIDELLPEVGFHG